MPPQKVAQSQFLYIPVALRSVPRILRLRFYKTSPPVLNTSSSLVSGNELGTS